ncbi:hypothetical protein LEP1GSC088_2515 [Leptospira interrogans str. L1207]|nr:hypothetical protein [Leptospira interrogans]EMN50671.1 hypothetical protein LEP1GSC088_2515 [Leptospira interrogans str. L1207]UML83799.1 hypothetical protein FH587_17250 [Leptospira interrogans]
MLLLNPGFDTSKDDKNPFLNSTFETELKAVRLTATCNIQRSSFITLT